MIIPVITGAKGITKKGLKNVFKTTTGKHSIDSLQNTALRGTSHILVKGLQSEITTKFITYTRKRS
jgi:hypothetical protein